MPQDFLSGSDLDQPITSLRLEIYTADSSKARTTDSVYCNVAFQDGSRLFNPNNFRLAPESSSPQTPIFVRDQTNSFSLPVPGGFTKTIREIDELYLRKSGSNGWLLGSALLFANSETLSEELPVIGNSQINQFLDNDEHTLFLCDWSSRSLCDSSKLPAKYPLLCPRYRIAGPVLGQVSDTGANILYRVDREGIYRLRVHTANLVSPPVFEQDKSLSPTATFEVRELVPNTHYRFRFFHLLDGEEIPLPDGDGEFRTFPADGSPVRFSFAFGSCLRNKHNVGQTAWTGIRQLAADPSADPLVNSTDDLRFFIHLGDTFYFHDDVTDSDPKNMRTMLAANVSSRKHPGFLEMARRLPSCAVWDDHDFRRNGGERPGFAAIDDSRDGFLSYWGNNPIDKENHGLTTLLTYGNVDIYLLDGRFRRDKGSGTCFSEAMLNEVVNRIFVRGRGEDRLVILASGSTWNDTNREGDNYGGDDAFETERETLLYGRLNDLMGRFITGLVFLSGDIHINEIYEVELARPGVSNRVAPEFVSSPLGDNSSSSLHSARDFPQGERKWSVASKGDRARRGFATLDVDTTGREPDGNWTIRVNYYTDDPTVNEPYAFKDYTLQNRQFAFAGAVEEIDV